MGHCNIYSRRLDNEAGEGSSRDLGEMSWVGIFGDYADFVAKCFDTLYVFDVQSVQLCCDFLKSVNACS